ncbi:nucleoside-diphosphate sugar epimerase [Paenibacillus sp. NEAU-GSW1]|uniref:nucleoside-diphosphate sugar epimerase n=1 Tax=Paenibacillus sp. NEAU-GSW1 TaxID=2682486 RepID=UPI0020A6887D|nr:nucleoside-diphosphate sugar epimerase [Paenibacillus sp. NEAU-GSW1]
MARIIESKRDVAVRMAEVVKAIPDNHPNFGGTEGLISNSQAVLGSVVSYLNSIADLEETMAMQLTFMLRELGGEDEE